MTAIWTLNEDNVQLFGHHEGSNGKNSVLSYELYAGRTNTCQFSRTVRTLVGRWVGPVGNSNDMILQFTKNRFSGSSVVHLIIQSINQSVDQSINQSMSQ